MSKIKKIKPFLKWAGGKTQLLKEIEENLPNNFNSYYEPFIGAGALLFHLDKKGSTINDINEELINAYQVIKNDVESLIEHLKIHKNESEYFYNIRNIDRDKEKFARLSEIQRASRILYMNKTCFNGLYRVNSKGQFNVPFGKYKNPDWINEHNLRKISDFLHRNEVKILNGDFEVAVKGTVKGDFIYLDPPYAAISETSSFKTYAKEGFSDYEQVRVRDLMRKLNDKGCYVMVSNSYTPFILDLYKEFNIKEIKANRAINSKGNKRGKVSEALITNY